MGIPLALEMLESKNLDVSAFHEDYQHLRDSKSLDCNQACAS